MKRYILAILIAVSGAQFAHAALTPEDIKNLPPEKIEAQLPKEHPSAYLIYSARLLRDGKKDEAVLWYYIGSIRYRFDLATKPAQDPSGDPALFGSLQSVLGEQINQYAGGDPKKWMEEMDRALAWDETTENYFTSKKKFKKELSEVRDGLGKMKKWVESNLDMIKEQRKQNGLETKG